MIMKNIIVTGASRGIGKAIALKLAEQKYNLFLTARCQEELEKTAELCRNMGVGCETCLADLTDENDVINLFKAFSETYGKLDVLVNNAGMGVFKPIVDTSLDEWHKVMSTNVDSAFLCCREGIKLMQSNKCGTIVNIASVVGIKGYPNQGAYSASKHAMVGLTKVIAEEYKQDGIRAHVICPGGVATEMVRQSRPDLNPNEIIQPEDIGDLVNYLLSLPPGVMIDQVHIRRFKSASF